MRYRNQRNNQVSTKPLAVGGGSARRTRNGDRALDKPVVGRGRNSLPTTDPTRYRARPVARPDRTRRRVGRAPHTHTALTHELHRRASARGCGQKCSRERNHFQYANSIPTSGSPCGRTPTSGALTASKRAAGRAALVSAHVQRRPCTPCPCPCTKGAFPRYS